MSPMPEGPVHCELYDAQLDARGGHLTLGAVRRLKDELLRGATPERAYDVCRAWSIALPLLDDEPEGQ
jgi:hypothetical protein